MSLELVDCELSIAVSYDAASDGLGFGDQTWLSWPLGFRV